MYLCLDKCSHAGEAIYDLGVSIHVLFTTFAGETPLVNLSLRGVEGAKELFTTDSHQFQNWAVELAGGFCSQKRSGDKGIDGRIHFEIDSGYRNMVISVKGGSLEPAYIRELRGVLEREDSIMAGFISLSNPTRGMIEEASSAGQWEYKGKRYNQIQMRTIQQLFDGIGFDTPTQVQTLSWDRQLHLFPR